MNSTNLNQQIYDKYLQYQKQMNELVLKKLRIVTEYRKKIDAVKIERLKDTLKGQS